MQIILLGMGIQSTCLYFKSCLGELPRADCAVFSDVGREGKKTYEYLDFLLDWQQRHQGIPIHVLRGKNLFHSLLHPGDNGRFTTIPAFTRNGDGKAGMLRRQCTSEYKIIPVDNFIRDRIYGLPKRARRPVTTLWYGITTEEAERMAIPKARWKLNTYPFLGMQVNSHGGVGKLDWGARMSRADVENWYYQNGILLPPESSCVFCPYQSDASWEQKRIYEPEDFRDAILVDRAIRDSTPLGIKRPVYLHRSCLPLEQVQFKKSDNKDYGECSGNCHT